MASLNPHSKFQVCDINTKLIDKWNKGEMPFFEPQLKHYYKKVTQETKNIMFTANVE